LALSRYRFAAARGFAKKPARNNEAVPRTTNSRLASAKQGLNTTSAQKPLFFAWNLSTSQHLGGDMLPDWQGRRRCGRRRIAHMNTASTLQKVEVIEQLTASTNRLSPDPGRGRQQVM
jgi:hypothetical protein